MEKEIKLVIADDHPLFRRGLVDLLNASSGLILLGEAENGRAALKLIEQKLPDIALLDVDMPELNGIDLAKELSKKKISTKLIFLTMYDEPDLLDKALSLGVMGYVLKESAVNDIVDCIKHVSIGKHYVSSTLTNQLIKVKTESLQETDDLYGLTKLTQTELKVLRLVASNKTTKEIAEELSVSPKTIENHRSNICSKLNLEGTNSLLRFALEHKSKLLL